MARDEAPPRRPDHDCRDLAGRGPALPGGALPAVRPSPPGRPSPGEHAITPPAHRLDGPRARPTRLAAAGLPTRAQDGTTCCHALPDKVWVDGPGAQRWEIYTVRADAAPELEGKSLADVGSLPVAFGGGEDCCCAA